MFSARWFLLVFVFAGMSAKSEINVTVNMDIASCAKLLSEHSAPSSFDFAVSETEALYIELLKDAAEIAQLDPSKSHHTIEVFVKKKAEFLNRMGEIAPSLIVTYVRNRSPKIDIAQIVNMVTSLGVSAEFYGLIIQEDFSIKIDPKIFKMLERRVDQDSLLESRLTKNKSFGFVKFQDNEEEMLPLHLHRSIGFSKLKVEDYDGPDRNGGHLDFEPDLEQDLLIVEDQEKGVSYSLPLSILQITTHATDEKKFELAFDVKQGGWIVTFESLVNPNRTIGF